MPRRRSSLAAKGAAGPQRVQPTVDAVGEALKAGPAAGLGGGPAVDGYWSAAMFTGILAGIGSALLDPDSGEIFKEGLRVREARRRGTASNAERRTKWHDDVVNRAPAIRLHDPRIPSDELARKLRNLVPDLPGHGTVLNFIRECEHDGTIPPRRTKKNL